MKLSGSDFSVDFAQGVPIAIPLDPHGPQPAFFTDEPASARPLRAGDYVGDVRLGGSCNAEVVQLVPHCHGTHTECRGHLTHERLRVQETIFSEPCLAQLISLQAEPSADGYPRFSLASLAAAWRDDLPVEAAVIRSLPNDAGRKALAYEHAPPYSVFSEEAIAWLAERPVKHLLVDSPSLDPAHDGGQLQVHRLWWCMAGNAAPEALETGRRSATEMIFVPDAVADGLYWLELGLSPLLSDATPSRPILYPTTHHPEDPS
jgi:kynurenine formamidase